MILPRRVTYCILLALTGVTLLFRYPLGTYHELGADTTFIHTLADNIVQNGRALWIVHPLSYFGLYALSYPSAMPFFFASGDVVTGLPVEGVVLIFCWIVAFVGAWSGFLAARAIRRDDGFALLVATLFALAPFFVKDTFWIASTRGFIVALLPVFILLLIRTLKTRGLRELVLAFALFLILATIHRMGFLAFFFLIAFAFALPFHKLTQRLRFALVRYESAARYAIIGAAVFGFLGMFYIQFLYPGIGGADVVDQYGTGAFFQGTSFPILVANMGVTLSGKVGPLFPLAGVGIIAYVWRRPKEVSDKFLLTATILYLPLLSLRDYMVEFLIPIFVILLAIGLMWLWTRKRYRRVLIVMVALLVASSMVFSWEMKDYWRDRYATDAPVASTAYQVGVYVRASTDGTIVTNDGLSAGQIAAVSGGAVMPLGGASLHWNGPQQLAWGFVNSSSIYVHILPLGEISFNTDEIYVAEGLRNAEFDWEAMLYYTQPRVAEQLFTSTYHAHYVVVYMAYPDAFYSYSHERSSPYLQSVLPSTSYKTFDNGDFTIWYRG